MQLNLHYLRFLTPSARVCVRQSRTWCDAYHLHVHFLTNFFLPLDAFIVVFLYGCKSNRIRH